MQSPYKATQSGGGGAAERGGGKSDEVGGRVGEGEGERGERREGGRDWSGVGAGGGDGAAGSDSCGSGVVEPIGPNRMFENVTDASGKLASTNSGSLPVEGQGPRSAPGAWDPSGQVESSHFMFTA